MGHLKQSLGWARVIGIDFEYKPVPGSPPTPICMVAVDFISGRSWEIFFDGPKDYECPIEWGKKDLVVAHNFSAEASCFGVLGWSLPINICCTMAEFRCHTNGTGAKYGLVDVCKRMGVPFTDGQYKNAMQQLAITGGPYTTKEKQALIAYCRMDVDVLEHVLHKMPPVTGHSLIRGRYVAEDGLMGVRGLPVDAVGLKKLQETQNGLQEDLATMLNKRLGAALFHGRSLSVKEMGRYLVEISPDWPRTATGVPKTADQTLKDNEHLHPHIPLLRQGLKTIRSLRKQGALVGSDGRHRFETIPFATSTGRTQPKGGGILTGPAFMRSYIQCPPKRVVVIADFKSQEVIIAAACSGDCAMVEDYYTDDFYLAFAKRAHAVGPDAQRGESPEVEKIRATYKQVALAVQYGMGATALSKKLGISEIGAKGLLRTHRGAYPGYWKWVEKVGNVAAQNKPVTAALGWTLHPPYHSKTSSQSGKNPALSIRNFPVQATGSEILRATVIRLSEQGFELLATVHDSVIVELPIDGWETRKIQLGDIMTDATRPLLNGHGVLVDSKVLHPGERYHDERGTEMWAFITEKLGLRG